MTKSLKQDLGIRLLVSAAALCAAITYEILQPSLLTPTIALLAIAALPWLASVIKSVKIPNVIELELRELREKVDQLGPAT